jgi:hypothetical protein
MLFYIFALNKPHGVVTCREVNTRGFLTRLYKKFGGQSDVPHAFNAEEEPSKRIWMKGRSHLRATLNRKHFTSTGNFNTCFSVV